MLLVTWIIYSRLRQRRKVQVGIGSGGVYFRGLDLIPWSNIKEIKVAKRNVNYGRRYPRYRMCLVITTYSPVKYGERISVFERVSRFAARLIGDNPDEIIIDPSYFIPISMNDLSTLLREYYEKYKEERRPLVAEDFPEQEYKEVHKMTEEKIFAWLQWWPVKLAIFVAVTSALLFARFAFGIGWFNVVGIPFLILVYFFRSVAFGAFFSAGALLVILGVSALVFFIFYERVFKFRDLFGYLIILFVIVMILLQMKQMWSEMRRKRR